MAFPVTLNGRTYTLADFEGTNYVDGLPDAFEDFVTHAGSIYKTTSTTSNTIGTGSKSFTTADNSLPYQEGTPLRISDGAAPATNWMDGIVTAYSGTSLTVNVVSYAGSGTLTDWDINIGGGGTSYTGTLPIAQGGTGATTAGAAATNLGLGTGDSPTFAGATITGAFTSQGIDDNATSTAMTLDSSNNLLVSKSSSSLSTVGSEFGSALNSEGWVSFLTSNNTTANVGGTIALNRKSTNGAIANFFKDGTSVGSIGTFNSDLNLGTGDTGVQFVDGSDAILPHSMTANSFRDNAISLGNTGNRFKDLYLSGGVYLGGTGSANLLDDYEEGDLAITFTPNTSGSISMNGSYNRAAYTKIGNLVTVTGLGIVSTVSSPVGYVKIPLPFIVADGTDRMNDSVGSCAVHSSTANMRDFLIMTTEGSTDAIVRLGDATTFQDDSGQAFQAGTQVYFSITYRTT